MDEEQRHTERVEESGGNSVVTGTGLAVGIAISVALGAYAGQRPLLE